MANEQKKSSSASVFLALIIGIILGIALFFLYRTFMGTKMQMEVPNGEMTPMEETMPMEKEGEEMSFLESLKTSILETFDVEGAPEVMMTEEPMMEEEYFQDEEVMEPMPIMEEDMVMEEEAPMESEDMLETLLDETPEPAMEEEPNEIEEMLEEAPMMELKLPSTGPDPALL